jgi:hypothetical protein
MNNISEYLLAVARSQSDAYIAAYQTGYSAGYAAGIKKAQEMMEKAFGGSVGQSTVGSDAP